MPHLGSPRFGKGSASGAMGITAKCGKMPARARNFPAFSALPSCRSASSAKVGKCGRNETGTGLATCAQVFPKPNYVGVWRNGSRISPPPACAGSGWTSAGRIGVMAGSVTWRPIATIPADRMDGRDVLLWIGHAAVCSWCDGWRDAVGRPVRNATHWADVEGPEVESCRDR